MAQTAPDDQILTEDAFLADRVQFWSSFCRFALVSAGLVVLSLIALAFITI
jgi:hypothetical protein